MAAPDPIVRQLVLCERVIYDNRKREYSLLNPRVDFATVAGAVFPLAYPKLDLFAQFTGSYGTHFCQLRMVDVTNPTATPIVVFDIPNIRIYLNPAYGPPYRLRSKSHTFILRLIAFPNPGRFELWIMFGGIPSAKVDLFVE